MLAKRKKNLELLDSSHGTDPEVADWNGLVKDLRNVVPKQRDSPKNQSGEMVTSLRGRIDSIEGRAEPGRRCCHETRRSLQAKDIQRTKATEHVESSSKDSQADLLNIRAPGQPQIATKGPNTWAPRSGSPQEAPT